MGVCLSLGRLWTLRPLGASYFLHVVLHPTSSVYPWAASGHYSPSVRLTSYMLSYILCLPLYTASCILYCMDTSTAPRYTSYILHPTPRILYT